MTGHHRLEKGQAGETSSSQPVYTELPQRAEQAAHRISELLAGQPKDDAPVVASHGLTAGEVGRLSLRSLTNRMREIRTSGSVGGMAGKPLSLPGKCAVTAQPGVKWLDGDE